MQKRERKTMSDYILRAILENNEARIYVATTKNLVNEARKIHNLSPVAQVAAGRLFTAGAMMGTMMKNDKDLLTVRIKGNGPLGQLMVTSNPKGSVKGFVANPLASVPLKDGRIDVASAVGIGVISVTKDLGLKQPYIGDTILVTSEIGDDLTYYFATSEQTPSAVGLGVYLNKENETEGAGGFIIQMMPNATDETIGILEANVALIKSVSDLLKDGKTPEDILELICKGLPYKILDKTETKYECDCSRSKVISALLSLGSKELTSLIEENKPVETTCQFCGKKYEFDLKELSIMRDGMLAKEEVKATKENEE